ncbi:hypothetical protein ACHAXS_006064 [Conticribra weissflogii]
MAGVGDNNTWVIIAATTAKAIQKLGSDLTICCIVPLVAWTSTMMDGIVQAGGIPSKLGDEGKDETVDERRCMARKPQQIP